MFSVQNHRPLWYGQGWIKVGAIGAAAPGPYFNLGPATQKEQALCQPTPHPQPTISQPCPQCGLQSLQSHLEPISSCTICAGGSYSTYCVEWHWCHDTPPYTECHSGRFQCAIIIPVWAPHIAEQRPAGHTRVPSRREPWDMAAVTVLGCITIPVLQVSDGGIQLCVVYVYPLCGHLQGGEGG